MAQKLTPEAVAAPFLGRPIMAREPGTRSTAIMHRVIVTDFQHYPALMERFGITPRLKETWERTGTEIYMTILLDAAEVIRNIRVEKFRESGASARPVMRTLTPTDQELRIISRILSHLTKA